MSITTYAELQDAVANFAERGDLEKMIPNFISLAEARLSRALDHPRMSIRASATIQTTSAEPEFVDLPADFQEMRRLYIKSMQPATLSLTSGLRARWRTRSSAGAEPTADQRTTRYSGPRLNYVRFQIAIISLEMVYRKKLDALSDLNTFNWLLTLAPDVYLYGALYHLAHFTGELDKMQAWDACYQTAMQDLYHHGYDYKYNAAPLAITIAGENTP